MNEFNLKKKNMRREAHFDKSNLLTKNGSDLIANKFKFISKKLDNYLILDEDIILDFINHNNSEITDINNISLVEGKFDAVISNFSLQISLFTVPYSALFMFPFNGPGKKSTPADLYVIAATFRLLESSNPPIHNAPANIE